MCRVNIIYRKQTIATLSLPVQGKYMSDDRTECLVCPVGNVSKEAGATECVQCPDGSISNTDNSECEECPAVSF